MKKTIIAGFMILIMLGTTACTPKIMQDLPSGKVDEETVYNPNVEEFQDNKEGETSAEVFLFVASEHDAGPFMEKDSGLVPADKYGIYTGSVYVEDEQLKNTKKVFPVNSEELTYSQSIANKKSSDSDQIGTFYSEYDIYHNDRITVEYIHGTDLIAMYHKKRLTLSNRDASYASMTEEEIREIADNFLKEILPASVLENMEGYRFNQPDILGRYSISYRRQIAGYDTDESVCVWIDKSGEVSGYNGRNVGKYDTITGITKEKLEATQAKLTEKIESFNLKNLKCSSPTIITNTSGEVFLKIGVCYDPEDGTMTVSDIILMSIS